MKRVFDILAASFGLLLLSPLFLFMSVWILLDSRGGVFYEQERIGQHEKPFWLLKFRTMVTGADQKGQLTIGKDSRITKAGAFLRKYKLDELPQLINVIKGDMSLVGPRPEVRKYVEMYDEEQKKVLLEKPGLTDLASLEYIDENELLGKADDPEKVYIEEVMPAKLRLNLHYIEERNFFYDLKIIFKTIRKLFG